MAGMSVADNLKSVNSRMREACARVGRDPLTVKLVAVSKGQPLAKISAASAAGQRVFGENYVQEALEKLGRERDLEWHFIGTLQSNKAKFVVGAFDLIHTIDRESVLQAVSKKAVEQGLTQKILIEVNVGGEVSKGGVGLADVNAFIRHARQLPGLQVRGLMCMPPPGPAESARPHFQTLSRILRGNRDGDFCELSMGTTQDFEVAIEEGATLVRIGTDVFGPRVKEEK